MMLRWLLALIIWVKSMLVLRTRRCMPGPMTIVTIGEVGMSKLQFEVTLPAAGAFDVIERQFTMESEFGKEAISLPGDATVVEGLEAEESTKLTLTLIDVDDAGNKSEPRVQIVVLVDNLAPPQPGEMGVQVTGEGGPPTPVDEAPVDEAPIEETPVEETPVDEAPEGDPLDAGDLPPVGGEVAANDSVENRDTTPVV